MSKRTVIVFWPYRRGRLRPDDRLGPCSFLIKAPAGARRALAQTERGRVRGFYTRHVVRLAGDAAVREAELTKRIARLKTAREAINAEIDDASRERNRLERQFIAELPAPTVLTDEDGVRWEFGR